jgi:ATP-dependent Zn protease
VAYHEAGHAVASTAINWQPVALCEVQFNGEGRTDYDLQPSEYRLNDIHREVAVLLAGRASEELFLGDISSGSGGGPQSDLAIATKLLTAIDNRSGLGASGLVWRQDAVMDDEAEHRLRVLLDDLYGSIKRVLKANEEVVHRLAEVLIAFRKIEGAPLNEILQKVKHQEFDLL